MEENKNPESQSVEKKSKNRKEKKSKITPETKKMIIKRIILIVLFLIIAIAVTAYFVVNNLPKESGKVIEETNKENKVEEKQDEISEKTIDLNGTYDINDLEISKYTETYKDLEIEYYQIDGLKDDSIEIKINYNLKSDITKEIDKALEENKINKSYFHAYGIIYSNFANTVSIYYNIYSFDNNEDGTGYEQLLNVYICQNYDLTTGNRLKLNDIFAKNINVGNIFANELYEDTISVNADMSFNEDNYSYTITDYNDIEEEIFKVVNDYNSEKDINFVFNEQHVTLLDYNSKIWYEDYPDSIVIYDKFLTDTTIFDGTYDKMDNIPNLAKRYDSIYTVLEKGENYYIDFSIFDDYINENNSLDKEKVIETVKNIVDEDVKKIKEEANQNPSKFIIANRSYSINPCNTYNTVTKEWEIISGMMKVDLMSYRFEITKSLFNSEVYDKIIHIFKDYPREETGEAYCYNNLFGMYLEYDYENNTEYLERIKEDERYILINEDGIILNDSAEDIPWETFD